jgi:hypothetical protein
MLAIEHAFGDPAGEDADDDGRENTNSAHARSPLSAGGIMRRKRGRSARRTFMTRAPEVVTRAPVR